MMNDWVEGEGRDFPVNERFSIQRNLVVEDRPLMFCLTMIFRDLLSNGHSLAQVCFMHKRHSLFKDAGQVSASLGQGEHLARSSSSVMPVDSRDQDIYTQNHKEN